MGTETVGLLMVCTAVVLGCRMFRVPATLPLLVVVLGLMQVGAVQLVAVPGLAQLAAMKTDLDDWTEERTEAAVEAVRFSAEVGEDPSAAPPASGAW